MVHVAHPLGVRPTRTDSGRSGPSPVASEEAARACGAKLSRGFGSVARPGSRCGARTERAVPAVQHRARHVGVAPSVDVDGGRSGQPEQRASPCGERRRRRPGASSPGRPHLSARLRERRRRLPGSRIGAAVWTVPLRPAHMARNLHRLVSGARDPSLPDEIARMSTQVTGCGECAHPDGARFVASTLEVFAHHVTAHLKGWCPTRMRRVSL